MRPARGEMEEAMPWKPTASAFKADIQEEEQRKREE
jgi:hypothetical protein